MTYDFLGFEINKTSRFVRAHMPVYATVGICHEGPVTPLYTLKSFSATHSFGRYTQYRHAVMMSIGEIVS